MKELLLLLIIGSCLITWPQQQVTAQAKETTEKRTTQSDGFHSRSYEAAILNYINELRSNPKGFYYQYIPTYIEKHKTRYTSYYTTSLKNTLLKQPPLPSFQISSVLQNIAHKQLIYLTQKLGGEKLMHNEGSITFTERVKDYKLPCFGENLYRSTANDPLAVVIDLLIDQGVASLGHRKNLLHSQYKTIGIQSAVAPNQYIVTVMDFGCPKE